MRGPKNHHSSPPKMRCELGILPICAGEQPWLVSVATVNDCGATMRAEVALGRPALVVVQRVRVVHALHEPPDVVDRDRLLELAGLHRHAHPPVEVGDVETGLVGRSSVVVIRRAPLRRASTSASSSVSRTLVSLPVIGISPSAKNSTRFGTLYDGNPLAQERLDLVLGRVGALLQRDREHHDLVETRVGHAHDARELHRRARRGAAPPARPARRWRRRS